MWEGFFEMIACLFLAAAAGIVGFAAGMFGSRQAVEENTIDTGYCVVQRDYMGSAVPITKDGAFVISHDYEHCLEIAKKYGDRAEVVLCSLIED